MRLPQALILSAALLLASLAARPEAAGGPAVAPESARQRAAEVVAALAEYRTSLETLLPLQERSLAKATEQYQTRRDVYERGIVSRRELEDAEAAVATAQRKVEDTRRAMAAAEQAMAEATSARALAGLPPLGPGGYEHVAGLIRYNGRTAWSLRPDTARLQEFFSARFNRPLPVSAFGQTPLHDRMGFDHQNALDVALHPDSAEGRALMEHLRTAGIPFIASWGAVAGMASGAHIHVGQPSPRIAAKR